MKLVCFSVVFFSNALLLSAKLNGEGAICGRPHGTGITAEEKVVAGYDVGYYRYPWYVALQVSNVVACGGSLIGSKAVLSAAHCYKEFIIRHDNKTVKLEEVYKVVLGIYNRCEKEKTQRTFAVAKVHIHEKYKENEPYYDISLLMLKESASAYQPICLPKAVIKTKPRDGTVIGLGTLKYHGATPCTLQEARLLLYSDMECRQMINKTGNDPKKVVRAFCAGYLQGGIDTCQGDSGGPFQITDGYGNSILLGIVSFGFHCANPGLLGLYTDVSQYVDWIEEKAGFNATMEGPSSPPGVVSDNETNVSGSKTSSHPQEVHVIHTFLRPVNIIILKNNQKNGTSVLPVDGKKLHRPLSRRNKKKMNKRNKRP